MYGMQYGILSKDGADQMNAIATLPNDMTVKIMTEEHS
jgi:hypothetical protein